MKIEIVAKLRELNRLATRLDEAHTHWSQDPDFRKLVADLHAINALTHGEELFPGQFSKQKGRATLDEVVRFCCTEISPPLSQADAEWFFHKCEGCGWKNNGRAILDWKATIRAWNTIKIFPSQKQSSSSYGNNGKNPQNRSAENPRNVGVCRAGPDYGEAARRKQQLQGQNAECNPGPA
jgi:hypothetical protein